MIYLIVNRSTRQPLGIVSADTDRELFEGMVNLSDESGLSLQHLEATDLQAGAVVPTPEWPGSVASLVT